MYILQILLLESNKNISCKALGCILDIAGLIENIKSLLVNSKISKYNFCFYQQILYEYNSVSTLIPYDNSHNVSNITLYTPAFLSKKSSIFRMALYSFYNFFL